MMGYGVFRGREAWTTKRGRRSLTWFSLLAALVLGAGGVPGGPAAAETAPPLRVCLDPDNLPFSSDKAATPGLYVSLARHIADDLGRPFEPVWYKTYFGKHSVRETLLSRKCDAFMGLPDTRDFMGPDLTFSKVILHMGYVLVLPRGEAVSSLDDLNGKRVAVQFSSTPQAILAGREAVTSVTVMSPEEGMAALAAGKVDAAFVWGPAAGYINKTGLNDRYSLLPVIGHGMQFAAAIGFTQAETALRDRIDQALEKEGATIDGLRAQYGLPVEPGIVAGQSADIPRLVLASTGGGKVRSWLSGAAPAPAHDKAVHLAASSEPSSVETEAGTITPSGADAAFKPADASQAAAGREIFNGTCSHCHGPDAIESERRINLRLLRHRYGDKTAEVFHYTVTHGRPSKGMPNWTGVFSEDDFRKILAYLDTVQADH